MAGSHLGGGASFGGSPLPSVAGFESDVNAEINVTPMIDVMLVLLIIFMVVTPALAGYTAILPRAKTAAPERKARHPGHRPGGKYIEGSRRCRCRAQLADELKKATPRARRPHPY